MFDYDDCHYIFDETHIYHCLEDNSRYVVGIFTFNGEKGKWIRFRQRRLQNNEWGGFINRRFEPFGYLGYKLGKHSYDNKFKPHTYDIQDDFFYSLELFNENKNRQKNGLKDLKPLIYNEEVIDARRLIVRSSIQTLQHYLGTKAKEVDVQSALNEYDKLVLKSIQLKSVGVGSHKNDFLQEGNCETSSSSAIAFEVMCLNARGYEGRFVNGGSYIAFEAKDDMIEVVSEDGSKHLMFEDRFVRV